MKKFFFLVFTIFQVLLLITAYGIQFFSMKKMGMMRYVLFINKEWQNKYPISLLQYASISILVLLFVAIILYVKVKRGNYFKSKKFLSMLAIDTILTFSYVIFTLSYSTKSYRSYYFTIIIFAVTALIQHIKIILYLKGLNKSLH
ncbi:hypothetical protein SDC9_61267 [bioreactor metagenome]|uniref:Uncharacterized protein n=1 Tax=bioreactor metagenome TaxID=1076179 RepID=A0A644XKZ0_9ZZZZ